MNNLILFIATFILCGCGNRMSEDLEYNFNAEIISINGGDESFKNDKFHTLRTCNIVGFKIISGNYSGKYFVLNSCTIRYDVPNYPEHFVNIRLDDKWIMRHNVKDTVHFDYLNRSRFFNINKRD